MLILAGLTVGVAAWDVTRTVGQHRDDPELVEGGVVLGAGLAVVAVVGTLAVAPPRAVLADGVVLRPPTDTWLPWGLRQALTAAIATLGVTTATEWALLRARLIDAETTLVRVVDRGVQA